MTTGRMDIDRRIIPLHASESMWMAPDGWPLRRLDWSKSSNARGSILFLTGRADHYEKYLEAIGRFVANGWRVTSFDWRGQGGSGRLLPDPTVGHIDDFSCWVDDLAAFWRDWKAQCPGPHVIVAHSMGGHLTLRALAEQRIDPTAIALCAPMLGLRSGVFPTFLLHPIARLMKAIGDPNRPAWKAPHEEMGAGSMRQTNLTHDLARFADEIYWQTQHPELRLGPPSWQWVERAIASTRMLKSADILKSITAPTLILVSQYDRLVDAKRIERDAGLLPNAELALFGHEAAHELLREQDYVRNKCHDLIDGFLARKAPSL